MPSWPDSLPPLFEVDGFSLEPVSNSTAIDVESGEPMTRNRFTGEMDDISGNLMRMTRQQTIELLAFWRYDLKNGTRRFTWDHPLDGSATEFLMTQKPKIGAMSGDLWQVSLAIQSMPQ